MRTLIGGTKIVVSVCSVEVYGLPALMTDIFLRILRQSFSRAGRLGLSHTPVRVYSHGWCIERVLGRPAHRRLIFRQPFVGTPISVADTAMAGANASARGPQPQVMFGSRWPARPLRSPVRRSPRFMLRLTARLSRATMCRLTAHTQARLCSWDFFSQV